MAPILSTSGASGKPGAVQKRLKRETGALVPLPPRGGGMPARVAPEQYDLVREIVKEAPDLTTFEVAAEFHRRTGRGVSRSAMSRTLHKLGLTRKKSR